jgi:hypothetical protein
MTTTRTTWAVTDVEDTRAREADGRAIPGSGELHTCERCGADHEIWATLSEKAYTQAAGEFCGRWVSTGLRMVVGVTCAKRMVKGGEVRFGAETLAHPRRARMAA